MSAAIDRIRNRQYLDSLEVLGDFDVGSFVPWLGMIGKLAGGAGGGATGDAAKKAAEEKAKAEAKAATTRAILYTVFGILGAGLLGTTVYLVARK